MNLRVAMFSLVKQHRLSPVDGERLKQLANFGAPPPSLQRHLSFGMAILAAMLGGLGVVFWVAANWTLLPRSLRFVMLEWIVICTLLGAWRLPSARLPLALLGFLACGSLFACLGQIYQTGADPWQLFALWAAVTLPLCLGVRHDVLWVPWLMVALTGTQLFSELQTGRWWWNAEISLYSSLGSWLPALALAALLRFAPRSITGAGPWPLRLSMTYAVISLTTMALQHLFSSAEGYPAFVLIVAVLAYGFSLRKMFDLFIFSALCLSFNVLVIGGLARTLFHSPGYGTLVFSLAVIACAATGLLALTVRVVVHRASIYLREKIS
jgi:uncharacterized membrane protein